MVSNTGDRGYEIFASRQAGGRAAALVSGQAGEAVARPLSRRRAADHAVSLRVDARQRQDTARDGSRGPRRMGRCAPARRWIAEDCLWVNSLVDRIVSEPLEPLGRGRRALRAVGDRGAAGARDALPPSRHRGDRRSRPLRATEALHPQPRPHAVSPKSGAGWTALPTMTVREAMADPSSRRAQRSL